MNTILFLLFLSIVLAKYKEESIFDWFERDDPKEGSSDTAGAIFVFVMFCYLPLMCILA